MERPGPAFSIEDTGILAGVISICSQVYFTQRGICITRTDSQTGRIHSFNRKPGAGIAGKAIERVRKMQHYTDSCQRRDKYTARTSVFHHRIHHSPVRFDIRVTCTGVLASAPGTARDMKTAMMNATIPNRLMTTPPVQTGAYGECMVHSPCKVYGRTAPVNCYPCRTEYTISYGLLVVNGWSL